MIPGLISRLSEANISLTTTLDPILTDIIRVSSTATTTVFVTIPAPLTNVGISGGLVFLVNSSGNAITATTAGNVATTCSIPNGAVATLVYSAGSGKWHVDKTT